MRNKMEEYVMKNGENDFQRDAAVSPSDLVGFIVNELENNKADVQDINILKIYFDRVLDETAAYVRILKFHADLINPILEKYNYGWDVDEMVNMITANLKDELMSIRTGVPEEIN